MSTELLLKQRFDSKLPIFRSLWTGLANASDIEREMKENESEALAALNESEEANTVNTKNAKVTQVVDKVDFLTAINNKLPVQFGCKHDFGDCDCIQEIEELEYDDALYSPSPSKVYKSSSPSSPPSRPKPDEAIEGSPDISIHSEYDGQYEGEDFVNSDRDDDDDAEGENSYDRGFIDDADLGNDDDDNDNDESVFKIKKKGSSMKKIQVIIHESDSDSDSEESIGQKMKLRTKIKNNKTGLSDDDSEEEIKKENKTNVKKETKTSFSDSDIESNSASSSDGSEFGVSSDDEEFKRVKSQKKEKDKRKTVELQSSESEAYNHLDDYNSDDSNGALDMNSIIPSPSKIKSTKTTTSKSLSSSKPSKKTASENLTLAQFKKKRDELATRYFTEFNTQVFSSQLTSVKVTWSSRLLTTAGRAILSRVGGESGYRTATIELGSKVLTDEHRLKSTLLHEMCHAAQWLISNNKTPSHGPIFHQWADKAMRTREDILITTSHSYDIIYKYHWACVNNFCGAVIKRQSRSVDTEKHMCSRCKGKIIEIEADDETDGSNNKVKTPKKVKVLSDYNLFIKANSRNTRNRMIREGTNVPSGGDVLKEVGRMWKIEKEKIEKRKARGESRSRSKSRSRSLSPNDENVNSTNDNEIFEIYSPPRNTNKNMPKKSSKICDFFSPKPKTNEIISIDSESDDEVLSLAERMRTRMGMEDVDNKCK